MSYRALWIVVGAYLMLTVGCGPTALNSQSADGLVAARTGEVHTNMGPVTVTLNAGWNAVGFQAASLTSLSSNSAVAGMAYYDNGYQTASMTMALVNAGAGTRRGFWLYATSPTSFTYVGTDSSGVTVELKRGWNMVAFPSSGNIPGSQLTCTRNGQPATLTSYVLSTFHEIGTGSNTPVDVSAGGSCKPGKAYWVYALEPVSLTYGSATPGGSPTVIFANGNLYAVAPGGTSPSFTLSAAHVITEMWTYHYLFSGTLGTLALKDASGTTYGPWAASGLTASTQPKWYWTVKPNLTLPAGTYTVIDSDPASWSQNAASGGKGHVQISGYPSTGGSGSYAMTLDQIKAAVAANPAIKWVPSETSISRNYSREQLKRLCGGPTTLALGPRVARRFEPAGVPLPAAFSWELQGGKNWTTPAKHQGYYGSCVTFATIGALETEVKLYNQDAVSNPDLSEWFVAHKAGILNGDSSGVAALMSLQTDGTVESAACPYPDVAFSPAPNPNPAFNPPPEDSTIYKITGYDVAQGTVAMKEALMTKGPLVTFMPCYEDIRFYGSTDSTYSNSQALVYRSVLKDRTEAYLGNHAILLIGWIDELGVWVVKNSWGTGWGAGGKMFLPFDDLLVNGISGQMEGAFIENVTIIKKTTAANIPIGAGSIVNMTAPVESLIPDPRLPKLAFAYSITGKIDGLKDPALLSKSYDPNGVHEMRIQYTANATNRLHISGTYSMVDPIPSTWKYSLENFKWLAGSTGLGYTENGAFKTLTGGSFDVTINVNDPNRPPDKWYFDLCISGKYEGDDSTLDWDIPTQYIYPDPRWNDPQRVLRITWTTR